MAVRRSTIHELPPGEPTRREDRAWSHQNTATWLKNCPSRHADEVLRRPSVRGHRLAWYITSGTPAQQLTRISDPRVRPFLEPSPLVLVLANQGAANSLAVPATSLICGVPILHFLAFNTFLNFTNIRGNLN